MRKVAIVVVILIVLAAGGALWLKAELARPYRGFSAPQVFVDIPRGTSRWSIANLLQYNGVIHSRLAFLFLSERHHRWVLQAGEYMFNQAATPRQVFAQIVGGHIFVHVVVVPEGWTMFDIAAELERQRLCAKAEFLSVVSNPSLVHDIAPQAKNLEGFLFPSTYQFSRNVSPQEMAATMVREFRQEWDKIQTTARQNPPTDAAGRDPAGTPQPATPPALTPVEVVTLASLVERETPQPQERPIVASVFYNRLKIGVPLQCDPTVQYALDLAGKPTPKVTAEDLHIQSPYNTYLHRGLPPGPIANPGDASLRAALNPAQTHYLYFVANGSGGHFFARTLEEHNRNVQKYKRILAGLPPEPPPPVHARRSVTQQAGRKKKARSQQ
ncbi:MAG: endolytic transglycosylase MltG [Candidatus Acidiferrales bacterium]